MTPLRDSLFATSKFATRLDHLIATVWRKGWDDKPPLDPDYLWAIGSKGYSPEDETSIRSAEEVSDFRERLAKLCQSLDAQADLNALGHTMAYGQLRNAIRRRHALGRLWHQQSEAARTEIAAPIIVLGQMRSGTTRMQRLLAADPKHAGTRFCDSHDPVPRFPDWRPLKAQAALALARRINPWLDMLHPFGATRTDEEIGWLSAALSPAAFEAQWRIPAYLAFSEARESTMIYREFARILRTDAAHRRNAGQARVLKCPQFHEDAAALLAQFPDARLVVCKRDTADVLSSSLSLVASQMAFQSRSHDEARLEGHWRQKIALRSQRCNAALASFQGPVAFVDFEEMNRDWRAVMTDVYSTLELDLSDETLQVMAREVARDSGGAHRHHSIQLKRITA